MNLDLMQLAMSPNPFLKVGDRLIFMGAIMLFENLSDGKTKIHLTSGTVIELSKDASEEFESEVQALVNKATGKSSIVVPRLSQLRQQ